MAILDLGYTLKTSPKVDSMRASGEAGSWINAVEVEPISITSVSMPSTDLVARSTSETRKARLLLNLLGSLEVAWRRLRPVLSMEKGLRTSWASMEVI